MTDLQHYALWQLYTIGEFAIGLLILTAVVISLRWQRNRLRVQETAARDRIAKRLAALPSIAEYRQQKRVR